MTRRVEVEQIDAVRRRLSVEIASEEVDAELARVFRELERTARIPGFRPGRAPRRVLERYFGDRVRAEVADRLIESSFRDILREKELRPVGSPEVVPGELSAGQPLRYMVTLEVRPEIELKRYAGLAARKPVRRVTDADVDAVLERIRDSAAQLIPVGDREELRSGDVAEVDYEILREGRVERRKEGAQLLVGPDAPEGSPGRALVGMRVGESREVDLAAEGEDAEGGKPGAGARFAATLRRIYERRLPAIDDEFAKDYGDADTLEEMRQRIRRSLELEAEREAERELRRALLEQLVAEHNPQVPESLVAARADGLAREAMRDMGIRPRTESAAERMCRSLQERLRPVARRQVQEEVLLDAIARREGIAITDEEIDEHVERMADRNPEVAERVRALYRDRELREMLRQNLLRDRALDFVVRSAVVETVEADSSVADPGASG